MPLENVVGKGENAGNPAFSPFPTMFSTLPGTNLNFSVTFSLLSANVSNFNKSKILSFGKEFKRVGIVRRGPYALVKSVIDNRSLKPKRK